MARKKKAESGNFEARVAINTTQKIHDRFNAEAEDDANPRNP